MRRLHGRDRWHALVVAPGQKLRHGVALGPARVRVADVGCEEIQEAARRLVAGGGDQGELVHDGSSLFKSMSNPASFSSVASFCRQPPPASNSSAMIPAKSEGISTPPRFKAHTFSRPRRPMT